MLQAVQDQTHIVLKQLVVQYANVNRASLILGPHQHPVKIVSNQKVSFCLLFYFLTLSLFLCFFFLLIDIAKRLTILKVILLIYHVFFKTVICLQGLFLVWFKCGDVLNNWAIIICCYFPSFFSPWIYLFFKLIISIVYILTNGFKFLFLVFSLNSYPVCNFFAAWPPQT